MPPPSHRQRFQGCRDRKPVRLVATRANAASQNLRGRESLPAPSRRSAGRPAAARTQAPVVPPFGETASLQIPAIAPPPARSRSAVYPNRNVFKLTPKVQAQLSSDVSQ